MSSHTPGPWKVIRPENARGQVQPPRVVTADRHSGPIATIGLAGAGGDRDADAELISLAPDLLECALAGARYCDALKALQDAPFESPRPSSDELDRLLEDWHDKTHAVLDRLKKG